MTQKILFSGNRRVKCFKSVGLRWVPTGKIFTPSTTKVDSDLINGSSEDFTKQYECEQTLDVSADTLKLSAAMTSDHNSSELGIHDHSNEQSSSKLVPKVVPSANKTATSPQELELLFHHHITMLRYKRRCYSLIPAESNSLPHAHTQTTKTYYKHQDSRIKKAQELKTKTSAYSDIKDNSAKYEHVGQDTKSQGGKDDQNRRINPWIEISHTDCQLGNPTFLEALRCQLSQSLAWMTSLLAELELSTRIFEPRRSSDYHALVMAISTISISLDSFEESVGTPSGRVLWFGRIPTSVPATTPTTDPPIIHDDTSLIPAKTPTISPVTSTIPPTAPTTHYTSSFIYTDSFDDDTPDTPPSPTHEIPPVEPIPHGRPYRYHPNGPVYMMTVRKRFGPLTTYRLALRHSVDYSSSDYFTFDDSSRDLPSDSSNPSTDALSDSSPSHSSSDHSSSTLPSGMRSSHQLCSSVPSIPHSSAAITERPSHFSSAGPSRKRSRSPTTSVLVSSPIPGALSSIHADLLPPRKRIRSSDSVIDLEVSLHESSKSFVPRETGLRVDVDVGGSDEPYSEPDIDPDV
ncbi:hypothetical protein Tco_0633083 [Tanacetum coccineum]